MGDQWEIPNQDQDAKSQWGTSSILQSPKLGLKGYGCSLYLQNQDRGPKFGLNLFSVKQVWIMVDFESWASLSQSKLISFSEKKKSESNFETVLLWADLSQAELILLYLSECAQSFKLALTGQLDHVHLISYYRDHVRAIRTCPLNIKSWGTC